DEDPLARFRRIALLRLQRFDLLPFAAELAPSSCKTDSVPAQHMFDEALRNQLLDDALVLVARKPKLLADLERRHQVRRVPRSLSVNGGKEGICAHLGDLPRLPRRADGGGRPTPSQLWYQSGNRRCDTSARSFKSLRTTLA